MKPFVPAPIAGPAGQGAAAEPLLSIEPKLAALWTRLSELNGSASGAEQAAQGREQEEDSDPLTARQALAAAAKEIEERSLESIRGLSPEQAAELSSRVLSRLTGTSVATRRVVNLGFPGSGPQPGARLGPVVRFEAEPGVNKTLSRHASAVRDDGDFARWVAEAAPEDAAAQRLARAVRKRAAGSFRGQALQFERVGGLRVDGRAIVFVPPQSFVLHSAETLHKSIQSLASLEGFYALHPAGKPGSAAEDFLARRFLRVGLGAKRESYLVPLDQGPELAAVLGGGGSAWSRPAPAPPAPSPRVSPGLVKTGRGTFYKFDESGGVTVYKRDGTVLRYPPFETAKDAPAYASHKAILARQGILIDSDDPVEAIRVALARNEEAIRSHHRKLAIKEARRGVHLYRLAESRRAFLAAAGPDAGRARASAVSESLRLTQEAPEFLPEFLRWLAPNDPALSRAPRADSGRPVVRVVRPFLYFRAAPGLPDFYAEARLISDRALHIQALHANLGELGLDLEREGLVAGGHLAFEYDGASGELARVSLEGNGLINLSRPGSSKLSAGELASLARKLEDAVPYARRAATVIDLSEASPLD